MQSVTFIKLLPFVRQKHSYPCTPPNLKWRIFLFTMRSTNCQILEYTKYFLLVFGNILFQAWPVMSIWHYDMWQDMVILRKQKSNKILCEWDTLVALKKLFSQWWRSLFLCLHMRKPVTCLPIDTRGHFCPTPLAALLMQCIRTRWERVPNIIFVWQFTHWLLKPVGVGVYCVHEFSCC